MEVHKHSAAVWHLALSEDKKYLASGGADNAVKLWNFQELVNGKVDKIWESGKYEAHSHSNDVLTLCWHHNSKHFCSAARDKRLMIWKVVDRTVTCEAQFQVAHSNWIKDVLFKPGTAILCTISRDKRAKIWEFSWLIGSEHVVKDIRMIRKHDTQRAYAF
eukprot:UN28100